MLAPLESLSAQIEAQAAAHRQTAILEALRVVGIATPNFSALRDTEVLQAVTASRDLTERFETALSLPTIRTGAPANDSDAFWPEEVTRHFRDVPAAPAGLVLRGLWRQVRSLPPAEAGARWAEILERRKFGRRLGPAGAENLPQVLRWLGVRTVPEDRLPTRWDPFLLGFRQVYEKRPAPGDLLISGDSLFAGAGVLTGTAPDGEAGQVLFVLGGSLFTGGPALLGEFLDHWRPQDRKPDYLLVPKSPFPNREGARLPFLDELLEAEESLKFNDPWFREAHRSSGPGLVPREWVVVLSFDNNDFAIFHLEVERKAASRRLIVVLDYYSRTELSQLRDFVPAAEAAVMGLARSLKYDRLDIFYKMVMPTRFSTQSRSTLEGFGYGPSNHPGWGRLPGKKLILQSTRR